MNQNIASSHWQYLRKAGLGVCVIGIASLALGQLPLSAGKSTPQTDPHVKFDPLQRFRHSRKGLTPQGKLDPRDHAWFPFVAKIPASKGPGLQRFEWSKSLSTLDPVYSFSEDVATDNNGNLLIVRSGDSALVAKLSPVGILRWKQQLDGLADAYAVATDSQGSVFISGISNSDGWVAKYSAKGSLLWKQQLGSSDYDVSSGVATDSQGNVFMTGSTAGSLAGSSKGDYDAWVAKYSSDGTLLWKRQLVSGKRDINTGVATDSQGNAFMTGYTYGSLGGGNQGKTDAWVAKYSPDGVLLWKQQLGTSEYDYSYGVATDRSGNVLITGDTDGALRGNNKGYNDAWVAKYSSAGTLRWKRQLGSSKLDYSSGVATDSQGNAFISGSTTGNLGADNRREYLEAFVAKYSPDGTLRGLRQTGEKRVDVFFKGVATDSNGNVFMLGDAFFDDDS